VAAVGHNTPKARPMFSPLAAPVYRRVFLP